MNMPGFLFNKAGLKFFIKKKLQHRYFPVNIAKFLRKAFVIKRWWLLSTWPYYILWMINELITFLSCTMSSAGASIITNSQPGINRYKSENDKQKKISLIKKMFFFHFCSWKCILHRLLILWFFSLHINYIKLIWTTTRNSRLDQVS